MTKRLIVNADDYGLSQGISAGIRQAHQIGIVTSASVMINSPSALRDLEAARRECPNLGLGVHLSFTTGRPVLPLAEVTSLVRSDGQFLDFHDFPATLGRLDLAELQRELHAQIEVFLQTGSKPTHLDCHHHAIYRCSELLMIALKLAKEYNIPVRYPIPLECSDQEAAHWARLPAVSARRILHTCNELLRAACVPHPDRFEGGFYDTGATLRTVLFILEHLPHGVTELMCHPGYVGAAELDDGYGCLRQAELLILCDPRLRERIRHLGIELANFAALT